MSVELYKYWALLLVPISIIGIYIAVTGIKEEIPDEQREYLDPVPQKLRKIWPLVNMFAYYFGERLSVELLVKYEKKLSKAGLNYMISPTQYFGLQMVGATLMAIVVFLCCYMIGIVDLTCSPLAEPL